MLNVYRRSLIVKEVCYNFPKEYTGSVKIIKNICFLYNICIVSPDIRTGSTEGILILFSKLFKTVQQTFG